MKHLILSLFVSVSSISTWAADAKLDLRGQTGSGGGVTVMVNGKPVPRDLIGGSCHWVDGDTFVNTRVPGVRTFLKRLHAIHWVMARELEQQIQILEICETESDLKQVDVEDRDGVTVFTLENRQAAIRMDRKVWIDMKELRAMASAPEHQVALVIHEALHGFLPADVPRRNDSLRSLVATLMEPTLNYSSLSMAIEVNSFQILPMDYGAGVTETEWNEARNDSTPLYRKYQLMKKNEVARKHNRFAPMLHIFGLNEFGQELQKASVNRDRAQLIKLIRESRLPGDLTIGYYSDRMNVYDGAGREYTTNVQPTLLYYAVVARDFALVQFLLKDVESFDVYKLLDFFNTEYSIDETLRISNQLDPIFDLFLKRPEIADAAKKTIEFKGSYYEKINFEAYNRLYGKIKDSKEFRPLSRRMLYRMCLSGGNNAVYCKYKSL